MLETNKKHFEALQEIKSMMERSSRFISLSGLSGVAAGVSAMLGAILAYLYLGIAPFSSQRPYYIPGDGPLRWNLEHFTFFALDALLVLLFALLGGIYFTTRQAKKNGLKTWDATTKRLLTNLFIPLATGGFFCIGLYINEIVGLIAPVMLIFYGLALIHASKYTLSDIRYLGYLEVGLGLVATWNIGYGLEFWTIGFGLLHILYGTFMYFKYESKNG